MNHVWTTHLLAGLALLSATALPLHAETIPALMSRTQSDKPAHWWQKRHAEKLALVRKGGAPYVFIGDSITHFWETTGKEVWNRYFAGPDAPYPALNLGYSADCTEHLLWRLEHGELDGFEAKLIFLMIGTNNTYFRWGKETPVDTLIALKRIIDTIRQKQPKATIVLHPIFPRGHDPKDVGRLYNNDVNRDLMKFADGKKVLWCDFTNQFLTPSGVLPREIMADEVHPTKLGYEIWASAILPYCAGSRIQRFPEPLPETAYPGQDLPRTMVPVSRVQESWWLERLMRNRQRIYAGTNSIDLVMMGDSITHYWDIGEGEDDSREILELQKHFTVMNSGYGGDWSENLVWRVKNGELAGFKAKVIAIQIGTNNFFWPNSPEDVAKGILESVRIIREKQPDAKVLLTSCFPHHGGRDKRLEGVNGFLAKAADDKHVFWLDIYDKFITPDGKLRKELFTDTLHPSAAGYRVWMDALIPAVEKLLK